MVGNDQAKGHFMADNLVVTCGTSSIMNKGTMKKFFKDVFFNSATPTNSMLLVDSWTSWRDSTAIFFRDAAYA
uniref:DDE-1 domain-containing protein n=1 Tax=Caenorhabditis japonica TaxID=281687 RepID=A0A8R1ID84_CAEJA